jgi:tRNA dimethylallyltransferase
MGEAIYLAGPTASGKSAVSLILARRLGGEIISVDSMQVYRGLDIGTAKPSELDRQRIPHHLIDVAEITEGFDAARFAALARQAEQSIQAKGGIPIFCGGTGLYFKTLVTGIGEAPPGDASLRETLGRMSQAELLEELRSRDPLTWERIDRQNPRRVIRALEVIRLTGRPFSELKSDWTQRPRGRWFGLERSRAGLNSRINERVERMFAAGLVEETRALAKSGLEENPTAMQAIGYRQVSEHLRGERDLSATIELVKLKTRQYAKRQMTWFKRQCNLQWIKVEPSESAENLAERIIRSL